MRKLPSLLCAALLFCALSAVAFPLSAAGTIVLSHPFLASFEDGPPVVFPDSFNPGDTVYFSVRLQGFTRKDNQVKLRFSVQPFDLAGIPLTPVVSGTEVTTVTPEDKEWHPKLRANFTLPAVLEGGQYNVHFQLTDELSAETVSSDAAFLVEGIRLEKNAPFGIRDLDFYRTEDALKPLATAAYRLSEEVHIRFQIIGFHHGEQGSSAVAYGLAVTDGSGRVLFEDPKAAEDQNSAFYPEPFVPANLNFSVKPGTPAGEYTLTITARDLLGNQTAEARRNFRLE